MVDKWNVIPDEVVSAPSPLFLITFEETLLCVAFIVLCVFACVCVCVCVLFFFSVVCVYFIAFFVLFCFGLSCLLYSKVILKKAHNTSS